MDQAHDPAPSPTASHGTHDTVARDGGHAGGAAVLDDASRPRLPRRDDAVATANGRIGQRTLRQVHEHLRAELDRVRQLALEVCRDELSPAEARDLISRTAMRQNYWTLGAFCASYCRVVSIHHTIEDQHMFTGLRAADPALGVVLDRLGEEHEVIAGLLDRLDAALVELVHGRIEPDEVLATVDRFATAMLSHLEYEEEQLLEPIGRLSIVV